MVAIAFALVLFAVLSLPVAVGLVTAAHAHFTDRDPPLSVVAVVWLMLVMLFAMLLLGSQ